MSSQNSSGFAKVLLIVLLVVGIGVLLAGAAGTLLYFNRDKLSFLIEGGRAAERSSEAAGDSARRPVVASAPLDGTEATYRSYLGRDDVLVMVDYYADWCGPCRGIAPSLSRLAAAHGDKVVILKVDVDRQHALASAAAVRSIPDVRLLHKGQELERIIGGRPYSHYEDLVLKHANRLPAPSPAATPPANPGGSVTPFDDNWLPPGVQPAGS